MFPQDALQSIRALRTSAPLASRPEANLVVGAPPPAARGPALAPVCNRREALRKKTVSAGSRTAPWLLRQHAASRGGAGPPCAQHLEDRSWGQWGTRAPSPERGQGTGRKSKSVPTAGGGGGLLRRPGAAAAAASGAHVSTTRMSGMDLGLGGLAILTLERNRKH